MIKPKIRMFYLLELLLDRRKLFSEVINKHLNQLVID